MANVISSTHTSISSQPNPPPSPSSSHRRSAGSLALAVPALTTSNSSTSSSESPASFTSSSATSGQVTPVTIEAPARNSQQPYYCYYYNYYDHYNKDGEPLPAPKHEKQRAVPAAAAAAAAAAGVVPSSFYPASEPKSAAAAVAAASRLSHSSRSSMSNAQWHAVTSAEPPRSPQSSSSRSHNKHHKPIRISHERPRHHSPVQPPPRAVIAPSSTAMHAHARTHHPQNQRQGGGGSGSGDRTSSGSIPFVVPPQSHKAPPSEGQVSSVAAENVTVRYPCMLDEADLEDEKKRIRAKHGVRAILHLCTLATPLSLILAIYSILMVVVIGLATPVRLAFSSRPRRSYAQVIGYALASPLHLQIRCLYGHEYLDFQGFTAADEPSSGSSLLVTHLLSPLLAPPVMVAAWISAFIWGLSAMVVDDAVVDESGAGTALERRWAARVIAVWLGWLERGRDNAPPLSRREKNRSQSGSTVGTTPISRFSSNGGIGKLLGGDRNSNSNTAV